MIAAPSTEHETSTLGEPEAVYGYADEGGALLFEVLRFPGKRFLQRRPDGNGGWIWNLNGTRRVLFHLTDVLMHLDANPREPIYVVEGERDVLAVEALDATATCNPGGAGKWLDEYSESLRGARRVVIVADTDEPGRRHARQVRDSLAAVGLDAEVVQALEGSDVSDHLAAGYSLEMLEPVELGELDPTVGAEAGVDALAIVPVSEFAAVDEPSAEALIGAGDEVVIAHDSLTVFFGAGGSGKTTLANDVVVHLASGTPWLDFPVPRPVRVLLIENEGPRGLFRRKLRRKLAGWEGAPWAGNVLVLEEPWGRATFADEALRAALAAEIDRLKVDLLVAGPVKRLGMEGGGTPDEVSRFHDLIVQLRAAVSRPLAVLLVHHENKAGDVSGAWSGEPDTLIHVRPDGRERTIVKLEKARWASEAHGLKLTLAWADNDSFTIVDRNDAHTAAARAAEEIAALDWLVEYVTSEFTATSAGVPRGKAETVYHEAHGNRGRNLARRVIAREIEAFEAGQSGEGTGEAPARLARGPGEIRNGVYLYPASHAPSPLAGTTNGEGGEGHAQPPEDDAARHLAAPPKGGEGSGEQGVGGGEA